MLKSSKSIGFAMAILCMPSLVSAASIRIFDKISDTELAHISDTGDLTSAGVFNGTNSTGKMSFSVSTTPQDDGDESRLSTIAVAADGAGWLKIVVTEDGFSGGASSLSETLLSFGVSAIEVGGKLTGVAYANNDNKLFAQRNNSTQIGDKIQFFGGSEIAVNGDTRQVSANLSDQFSLTSIFYVRHSDENATTAFSAAQVAEIAPVPLPAGGVLLLTALAGIGIAKRRRKSA